MHNNAAGVGILPENFEAAKKCLNDKLKNVTYDPNYQCDFIIDIDDFDASFIYEIDSAKWVWCKGIDEPTIAIENISIARKDIVIQGKNYDSIAFMINDIKYVMFKMSEGNPLYDFINEWDGEEDDIITLNVIGECKLNLYNGIYTPQVTIQDVEIIKRS